ncbi:MAG: methyltransferase type 11 [Acidobacteria bacterium RIFCSPLOWO2_02_FULL_65_29]|nr:MAG: methyltransferase type 11 [Acidobacteria bacterium RIFCSPLOWO2_02_FULL_65_29]
MKRFTVRCSCVLAVLLALSSALAVSAQAPGRHPISGRQFAGVMGWQGAPWLEREERDIEEAPDTAIDALDLEAGQTVADIGAGSGYMSVRMAKRVGPTGRVFAEDIQPEMIDLLKQRLARERVTNVTPVLGLIDNPRLPDASVDLMLLVDVYHEFSEPQKMLRGMRAALKPDGRLVLLEYRKEDPTIPIRLEHKMTVAEAKLEVEAEGFTLSKVDGRLPRQHILIFIKK